MQVNEEGASALAPSDQEPAIAERASRLKEAIRAGGGNKAVAARAGIPVGTLNHYIGGRDMKASAMIALARAAGVRLEWLATGEGPMRHSEASSAPTPSAPSDLAERPALPGLSEERATSAPSDLGLTWQVNPDRLARAYELALKGIAILPGHKPDPRRLMQVTLLLYDEMTEAEATAKAALNAPQTPP